ncbi:hypothetical protein [Hymenobacter tenuis]
MPTKVTPKNAHLWSPPELIAREDELRRQELGSKYRSISRESEIRLVRLQIRAITNTI